jgi:hypothetical protein
MGLLAGGSSLLGSIFSSSTSASNTQAQIQAQQQMQGQSEAFNASQSAINRDWSAGQAQLGRDYTTQMSNTAYQRAATDMKTAGLNPMMMAGGSMNASTPSASIGSGSAASIGTPNVPMPSKTNPLGDLGKNLATGIDAAVSAKTLEKMTDEIANIKQTRNVLVAEEEAKKRQPALTEAQTRNINQQTKTERENTLWTANKNSLTALDLPAARFSARQSAAKENMPDFVTRWGEPIRHGANWLSDLISPLVSSAKGAASYLAK